METRWRQPLILLLGLGAVALATVLGRGDVAHAVLEPPPLGRLALGVAAGLLGGVVSLRAVERLGRSGSDPRALVRAVRLVFLAVAAFAASAGWFLGSALPIVVALVIAGIDVIETTVLLLVVRPEPVGTPDTVDPEGDRPEAG